MTPLEEERLFAQLTGRRSHLAALVRFDLETGLRKGELCRLETEHVNLSEEPRFFSTTVGRVEVKPNELIVVRSKSDRPRTIPLSPEAQRIAKAQIADATNQKYLFTSNKTKTMIMEIKRSFSGAVRDAGIQDFVSTILGTPLQLD